MTIKPILFNTEMVRAILDGRKSCTRRVVKFPVNRYTNNVPLADKVVLQELRCDKANFLEKPFFSFGMNLPYQPGDILYVRETFIQAAAHTFWYKADDKSWMSKDLLWKPSIHMPKEAARIWLKVTDVRVERLQDMDWQDALYEGIDMCLGRDMKTGEYIFPDENPLDDFIDLWDSTIKKSDLDRYGWHANPWVWVIEFEQCEKLN